MAADYAFLIAGLIDLYEAGFDPAWLDWALELTDTLQAEFFDPEKGGYYMTAPGDAPHLLMRVLEDADNVIPSASSVASMSLLRLAQLTGRKDLRAAAEKTLARFAFRMREGPSSALQMLSAGDYASGRQQQIVIAGPVDDPATLEMLRLVHSRFLPAKVLLVLPPGKVRERLAKRLPMIKGMVPIDGKPTAYVCVDYACELPTNDLETVRKLLDKEPER